jgi:energy-coupling factor transporter transmembrane protein EcfT
VIGTYIIAALCILAALSQGWVVTLIVAVFLVLLLGIVMGEILAPRIFSSTVGVHPIVAIFALFAGAELFGLLGGSSLSRWLASSSRSSWQSGTDGNTSIPKNSHQKRYPCTKQRCCQNKRAPR